MSHDLDVLRQEIEHARFLAPLSDDNQAELEKLQRMETLIQEERRAIRASQDHTQALLSLVNSN